MVVNKLIDDVFKERNLSVPDAAALSGLSSERIFEIISCKTSVSTSEARRLLDAVGSSLSDVICWY